MFVQQLLCYCKLGQSCEPAGVNNAGPCIAASCRCGERTRDQRELHNEAAPLLPVWSFARLSQVFASGIPQSIPKPPADSDLNERKKPDLSDMFCPVEIGLCFSLS